MKRQAAITELSCAPPLYLSSPVLSTIRNESIRGLTAISHRGLEIGGFLGSRAGAASVDSLFLHECSYSFGPSFQLSSDELTRLAQAAQLQNGLGVQVLAYFRSCTRARMELTSADLEVLESLPKVRFVLMYKARMTGGDFALFDRALDGSWNGPEDPGYPMCTSAEPERMASNVPAMVRQSGRDAANSLPPAPAVTSVPLETADLGHPRLLRATWYGWVGLLLAGIVVCLMVAAVRLVSQRTDNDARAKSSLGLRAHLEDDSLQITWDRNSSALRAAKSAKLTVQDGHLTRVVSLDRSELLSGSVVYAPRSGDVSVKLELSGVRPEMAMAAVRWLGAEIRPRTKIALLPPQPRTTAAPLARQEVTLLPTASTRRTMEPIPSAQASKQVRQLSTEDFGVPEFVPQVPGGTTLPDPLYNTMVSPPPAPLPATPSAPPVISPSSPNNRSEVFVPPTPLVRFQPDSHETDWRVNTETQVSVRVRINSSGVVVKANAETAGGKPLIAPLVGPSLRAASKWRFAPATRNGQKVESAYVITFRFRPN
jgi:hypothetical protein